MKKNAQSIFDSLIRIMPELQEQKRFGNDSVDPIAANALFQIWRTSRTCDQKTYKRPKTFSHDDLQRMQKAGLVNIVGDNCEITDKGVNVIKVMILGDDRSIFEENNTTIDYNTALNKTREVKVAKKQKVAETWWDRFETKIAEKDEWIQDAIDEEDEGKFKSWCKRNGFKDGVSQSCINKAISEGGHAAQMANFAINVSKGKYNHPQKDS